MTQFMSLICETETRDVCVHLNEGSSVSSDIILWHTGSEPEVQFKELMSLSHSDILLIEAHHSFISVSVKGVQ